ncbi:MAG: OmpH family outer membrane protein [Bacteroidota bacterium]
MKRFGLILLASFLTLGTLQAQRIAYVDVDQILTAIPEYKVAQDELDQIAAKWKSEIQGKYNEIDQLYRRYQAEQVLLSESQQTQREEEIVQKEKDVQQLQRKRFGPEGELFEKRKDLVQPIQERVYTAIENYAKERGFDFVLDKSSGVNMLYANPEFDRTKDVMKKLGIKE